MVRKKPIGWRREHARHVAAGKGIKTTPGARWSGKWKFHGLEWGKNGPIWDSMTGEVIKPPWHELVAWRYKGDFPHSEGKIGKMVRALIDEQKDGSYVWQIYILSSGITQSGRILGKGKTHDLEAAKRRGLRIASEYLKS